MDVEELLARAWGAVEKAGIPEPLQEFAFKEALARLSGQVPAPAAQSASPNDGAESTGETPAEQLSGGEAATLTEAQLFVKFAAESGIPVEDLERVFYFKDGEPHLNGPRAKLGKTAADQAKVVALAMTAAYDYALDKQVPDETVRAEAARLKCDLGGNWARTMDGHSMVSRVGASRQKTFKVKADTAEVLKKTIAAVLGTSAE